MNGTVVVAHPDGALGAPGRATLSAVEGLLGRSWHVLLVTPVDGPLLAAARDLRADTVVLGAGGPLLGLVRASALLRRVRPDVLHVRDVSMSGWICAARLLRTPVVTLAAPPVRASIGLSVATFSSRLLVHSEHDRRLVIRAAPRCTARTTALRAPFSRPVTLVPPRAQLTGPVRLVHVGGAGTTGADVARDAVLLLIREGVDARLEFTTSDENGTCLRADVVLVHGDGGPEARDAAVGAVLAGRPLVVSDSADLVESIEGFPSALRVPAGDSTALAVAVLRIVANWSAFRRTAVAMAPIAGERHRPDRYGRAVALLLDRAVQPRPEREPIGA